MTDPANKSKGSKQNIEFDDIKARTRSNLSITLHHTCVHIRLERKQKLGFIQRNLDFKREKSRIITAVKCGAAAAVVGGCPKRGSRLLGKIVIRLLLTTKEGLFVFLCWFVVTKERRRLQ